MEERWVFWFLSLTSPFLVNIGICTRYVVKQWNSVPFSIVYVSGGAGLQFALSVPIFVWMRYVKLSQFVTGGSARRHKYVTACVYSRLIYEMFRVENIVKDINRNVFKNKFGDKLRKKSEINYHKSGRIWLICECCVFLFGRSFKCVGFRTTSGDKEGYLVIWNIKIY